MPFYRYIYFTNFEQLPDNHPLRYNYLKFNMENDISLASDPETLKTLFIYYLNKIYDGKLYLRDNLPKVIAKMRLKVLRLALEELLHDVLAQIKRMEHIYRMLGQEPMPVFDAPMKTIIQSACDLRNTPNPVFINDMDIMMHMQLVEHVNIISYRILRKIASLLKYDEIVQLMTECFDESADDDKLFYAISKEYLTAEDPKQ